MAKKTARRRHYPAADELSVRTRRLLRSSGLRARKALGQHFLVDEEVLRRILSAAELSEADVVMEVGPGLGILTAELAKQAGWVIAIELDDRLAAVLRKTMASSGNVSVVNDDVLKIEPADLIRERNADFPPAIPDPFDYKVVANLPYYITSPVLRHFLEAEAKPRSMVVMVQKEVAEAIAAPPGRMSALSVSVQFYGRPSVVDHVPARSFYPEPEVDSAILRIDLYPRPALDVPDKESFFELVHAGFSAPRKQLANSLAQGLALPVAEVLPLLAGSDIDRHRRAETLTLEEWARLWQESVQIRKPR